MGKKADTLNSVVLLIVPYGIETLAREKANDLNKLLIVPYGIETIS